MPIESVSWSHLILLERVLFRSGGGGGGVLLPDLFPRRTRRLLVAVLAADITDGGLPSRLVPLLRRPWQSPQLQVGMRGRSAWREKWEVVALYASHSSSFNQVVCPVKVRRRDDDDAARTSAAEDSPQESDLQLQAAEDLIESVRVRQEAAGLRDLGGVALGVVVPHKRQTEHAPRR